jgi:uncharacterized membrane protein
MRQPAFVPYAGSEGYSPAAYLPQAAAALLARIAKLEFVPTLYLMRAAGLAAMTAVVAYAIALTPVLKWPFVGIAMLPSALNARAVINADAAAFAFGLVVIAFFLRTASGLPTTAPWRRSAWITLCALAKPPNLAFILLEWLRPQILPGRARWRAAAIVTLPALAAAVLWTAGSSADVAAWRLVEITGIAAQEFDPAWKLRFMLSHPTEFPAAVLGLFQTMDMAEFFRQLIGVLGLFDTVLRPWVYVAIGLLLVAVLIIPCEAPPRLYDAGVALIAALAYIFAVILILYLIWTPVRTETVWGLQGRYFVPILPLLAVVIAATVGSISIGSKSSKQAEDASARVNLQLARMLAIAAAVISGAGSIEAILRADWNL